MGTHRNAAETATSSGGKREELIRHATDKDFDTVVAEAPGAVLIDLWASWCPPCRALAPILERVAKKFVGRLTVVKVDVDESPATADKFKVDAIPTLVLLNEGRKSTRVGCPSKKKLEAWLDAELRPSAKQPSRAPKPRARKQEIIHLVEGPVEVPPGVQLHFDDIFPVRPV